MLEDKLPELEFVTGSVIRVLPADPSSSAASVALDDPGEDRRHSGGGAGAVLAVSSSSSSAGDGSGGGGGGGGDPVRAAQAVLDAMLSEVPGRKEDVYVVLDQDAHGYPSYINAARKSYENSNIPAC